MPTPSATHRFDEDFLKEVQQGSEQNLTRCYQCGNCTAGCPLSFAYDIPVNRLMRLLQAGEKHAVLSSKAIWLCASCETCTTRCPNMIDVACVMDVLRHMARREGLAAVPQVKTFWDSFLDSVRAHGRVFELGLLINYVTKTGRFWTDMDLGPKILPKGKLAFKPHDIQGKEHVARIFERFERESNS